MRFTRRLATLMIGGAAVAGGLTATGITAPAAYAGLPITRPGQGPASD